MYQVGQQLVYGAHGVCTVVGLESRIVDRKPVQYLCLQPLEQSESRYYVPTHNDNAMAKLRPLIEKQALLELLNSEDVRRDTWISDEGKRKLLYRQLITSLDLEAMIRAIHTLRLQKQKLLQEGKKFHLCDENFLRDAQKLLRMELTLVLQLSENELDEKMRALMGEE